MPRETTEFVVVELNQLGAFDREFHDCRSIERRAKIKVDHAQSVRMRSQQLIQRALIRLPSQRQRPKNDRGRSRAQILQGCANLDVVPRHVLSYLIRRDSRGIKRSDDGSGRVEGIDCHGRHIQAPSLNSSPCFIPQKIASHRGER